MLVLTCGVNYVGLVWATRYQGLTALLKVIAITALIVAGLLVSGPALESVPATDIEQSGRGLALAMLLIFFSYTGWTRLGYAAGEMKNPRQVLPRAIGIGLTITIVLYVLLNVVSFRLLGLEGVRGSNVVVSDVAAHIFGDGGSDVARLIVAGLIVASVTGSMSVSIMANSRLYFAMAKDGLFFKRLDHIHPLFRTPDRAILFHGSAALVMLLVRHDFASLVTTAIFLNMVFYIIKTHTLFTLRRQGVGEEGCYRVPFYPWLPLLFLVSLYGLFVARLVLDWQRAWFDLALLALGIPASILWLRYRKP